MEVSVSKRTVIGITLLMLLALALSACGVFDLYVSQGDSSGSAEVPAVCEPEPGALTFQGIGVCFSYPEGYTVEMPVDNEVMVRGPVPQAGTQPIAFVIVSDAEGRTAQDVADARITEAQVAIPGFEADTEAVELGGYPAVAVYNLPGQDVNWTVFAVVSNTLVEVMVVPMDPTYTEPYGQAVALYTLLLDSFDIVPQG